MTPELVVVLASFSSLTSQTSGGKHLTKGTRLVRLRQTSPSAGSSRDLEQLAKATADVLALSDTRIAAMTRTISSSAQHLCAIVWCANMAHRWEHERGWMNRGNGSLMKLVALSAMVRTPVRGPEQVAGAPSDHSVNSSGVAAVTVRLFSSPDWSDRWGATAGRAPMPIAARVLPHRFLTFALHLNYDRRPPATKGPGQGCPRVGCGHHQSEHCEGGDEHHASKPRLWLCGHPPHHDPGESPSLSR